MEFHRHIAPYKDLTFQQWIQEKMPHHYKIQNQTDYVREKLSPLLQANYIRDIRVDYIGRLEKLETEMQNIISELNNRATKNGLEKRFHYSNMHINRSNRQGSIASYYSLETEQIVAGLLSEDFEIFNYPKKMSSISGEFYL